MLFNYRKMSEEAKKTGQPVTRSRQLGCQSNALALVSEMTLDTTFKVPPFTSGHNSYQASFALGMHTYARLKSLIVK